MFISYQNFGLFTIQFLFKNKGYFETTGKYGYKDALAAIKAVNEITPVATATLVSAITGEIVADIFPNIEA